MRSKSSSFSGELSSSSVGGVIETVKLVFVGDAGVGKTTMLSAYRKGGLEEGENKEAIIPVLEGFTKSVMVGDKEHVCLLWDTIGSTDFETLRPLSYPKTDCFVICFAINDRTSFENLKTVWLPEIETHSPQVPYIFVATKTDMKKIDSSTTTAKSNKDLLTIDEIMTFVTSTEGLDYVECSSRDVASIENILKSGVKAVSTHEEKLKAIKDANSSQSFCVIF